VCCNRNVNKLMTPLFDFYVADMHSLCFQMVNF